MRAIRPDGHSEINQHFVELFNFLNCPIFNGLLKPDIIFFGDNVPKIKVDFFKKLKSLG